MVMGNPKRHSSYRDDFSAIAKSKNYKVSLPSRIQSDNNIDLLLEGQVKGRPTVVTVDIKKRNGKHSNSWVYIEYVNSKGRDGWLYGWAEFVVFETSTSFIFVSREELLKFLKTSEIVRWDLPFVDQAWKSKYRLFRRQNTLEKITQIEISHLMSLKSSAEWKKL